MAAPSVNFCYGNGLQRSSQQQPYRQPPAPLFPYNTPLPQPLFNSNPWVAQCMPPVQCHYQQQHLVGTNYRQQQTRGRGKNWQRQVINVVVKACKSQGCVKWLQVSVMIVVLHIATLQGMNVFQMIMC